MASPVKIPSNFIFKLVILSERHPRLDGHLCKLELTKVITKHILTKRTISMYDNRSD